MKAIDALPRHQSATGRSGDDLSRYEVAYILRQETQTRITSGAIKVDMINVLKLQQRLRPIRPDYLRA
jgi:hypothetical protein